MLSPRLRLGSLLASSWVAFVAVLPAPAQHQDGAPAAAPKPFFFQAPDRAPSRVQEAVAPASARVWLGVSLDPRASSEATSSGARVLEVRPDSPAASAGLRAGDRLLALDGQPIPDAEGLVSAVRAKRAGAGVELTLVRTLSVTLDKRGWGTARGPRLGVHLVEQSARPDAAHELVLSSVEAGWPAMEAGLSAGDRIVRAGTSATPDLAALQAELASVPPGGEIEIQVERTVHATLGLAPQESASAQRDEAAASPATPPAELERRRMLGWVESGELRESPAQGAAPTVDLAPLRAQIEALAAELRALRNEVREMRGELERLHTQGAAGGAR